jgi:hypothetical protein
VAKTHTTGTPVYRCAGHDEFDKFGNHWLCSGRPAAVDGDIDRGIFAACIGLPAGRKATSSRALKITPRWSRLGSRLPIVGIRQAASEVRACWVLRARKDEERPIKLKDARKPLQVTCSTCPESTQASSLSDGAVHSTRGVDFFGAAAPGASSEAPVGIGQEFAVTLHKSTEVSHHLCRRAGACGELQFRLAGSDHATSPNVRHCKCNDQRSDEALPHHASQWLRLAPARRAL